ncbi:MAG TPA: carboxypeptidase regulatory-like domain-containing protein [Niabella sp.]|nr:carboxypeptidase regulatory-like domain-containing protein [Niabella sp.]
MAPGLEQKSIQLSFSNNLIAIKKLLYRILIGLMLLTATCVRLSAQPLVTYPGEPLHQRLERIVKDFNVHIAYDQMQIRNIATAEINMQLKKPEEALNISLQATGYTYQKRNTTHFYILPVKRGVIRGHIIDADDATALPGVSVKIGDHFFAASADGTFYLELPAGSYPVLLSAVGYQNMKLPVVELEAGQSLLLNLALQKKPFHLPQVNITASVAEEQVLAYYIKRRQQVVVADGLVKPQITSLPDEQISKIIKRINGVNYTGTTVGIRGLSERYSQVLLDGIPLPSLGFNRRALMPDIIPKELSGEITLIKTAAPDINSDFTGGQIQIQSLAIPDQSFTSFSLGTGGNSQSVFKNAERLGNKGKLDWLGIDDGSRKKPAWIRSWQWYNNLPQPPPVDPTGTQRLIPSEPSLYTSLDAIQQSKGISAEGLVPQNSTTLPDFHVSFSLGRAYALKGKSTLGLVWGTSVYQQQSSASFYNLRRSSHIARQDSLRPPPAGGGTQYEQRYGAATALNLGLKKPTFRITLNNILSTQLQDNFSIATRSYFNKGQTRQFNELFQQPEPSFFHQHKLELGKQFSASTSVNYFIAFTNALQQLSDRRHLQYFLTASGSEHTVYNTPNILYNWRQNNDSNIVDNRTWIDAIEKSYLSGLSFTQRSLKLGPFSGSIKAGWSGSVRHKIFSVMRLLPYAHENAGITGRYHELLHPSATNNVYYWAENTNGTIFTGRAHNQAFYLLTDQSLGSHLRFYYGLRAEYYHMQNNQQAFLKRLHNGIIPAQYNQGITGEKNWNLLPSAHAIVSIRKNIDIRIAYSETLLRPDFRELSYFGLYDYELDANINGRQLLSTRVSNYDARWEWYPTPAEIISISLFHKQLNNPVELAQSAPFPNAYGYINQHSAQTTGIEIELRKSMAFISPGVFLKNLHIHAAYTANWSKVAIMSYPLLANVAFTQRRMFNQDRPLFNQAPWTLNAALLYNASQIGISVFYNQTGPKTYITHINPNLIEYENSVDELDIGGYIKCWKGRGRITLSALNLLNQWRIYYRNNTAYRQINGDHWELANGTVAYNPVDGDTITYRIRQGIRGTIGLIWKF